MPSPRNSSILAERVIHAALDMIDKQKEHLCGLIESEHTSPETKYEALIQLATMIGTLTSAAEQVGVR